MQDFDCTSVHRQALAAIQLQLEITLNGARTGEAECILVANVLHRFVAVTTSSLHFENGAYKQESTLNHIQEI